jgi:hypothetical protein
MLIVPFWGEMVGGKLDQKTINKTLIFGFSDINFHDTRVTGWGTPQLIQGCHSDTLSTPSLTWVASVASDNKDEIFIPHGPKEG